MHSASRGKEGIVQKALGLRLMVILIGGGRDKQPKGERGSCRKAGERRRMTGEEAGG